MMNQDFRDIKYEKYILESIKYSNMERKQRYNKPLVKFLENNYTCNAETVQCGSISNKL